MESERANLRVRAGAREYRAIDRECRGAAALSLVAVMALGSWASGCAPGDGSSAPPLTDPSDPYWTEAAPPTFDVRFETTAGDFVVRVVREWSPHGADRFYNLARSGYLDGQRFTRVVPEFICQWGIHGDPAVSQAWRHAVIPDDPVRVSNTRGRIAYAMTGPDTRTTQFYISLVDNSRLDEQGFSPFGEVVEGLEVVDRIHAGYGENAGGGMRRGNQDPLFEGGNAYIDRQYPELDHVVRAAVVGSS